MPCMLFLCIILLSLQRRVLRGCERICVADYSNQCVSDCAFLQQSQLDECEFSYEQCKWPCAVGDGNCERFGISQLNSFTLSCILLISENVKSFAGHAKRMRVPAAIFVQKNVLKRFVVTPSFFSYTLFYSLFSILYCLFFILYLPHSPLSTPASPAAKTTVSHRWRMDSRCASSLTVNWCAQLTRMTSVWRSVKVRSRFESLHSSKLELKCLT